MSRIIIKGTNGLIDCGGTIVDLGKEEYKKRYQKQVIKAHVKLGQYEDMNDNPDVLAKRDKALEIIKKTLNLKVYKNKLGQCFLEGINILIPIEQEEYDLLKEVLL